MVRCMLVCLSLSKDLLPISDPLLLAPASGVNAIRLGLPVPEAKKVVRNTCYLTSRSGTYQII